MMASFMLFFFLWAASAQEPKQLPSSPPNSPPKKESQGDARHPSAEELIQAIEDADLSKVWELLEDGADPNATKDDNKSALVCAVVAGQAQIAETLLARHAQVDAENANGGTALSVAAGLGHADLVKILIAYGADVNHRDHDGHTALMCAAFGSTIKNSPAWLARSMFELDEDDDLFTHMGSEHLLAVKLLLDAQANVNGQGKDCGLTALMIAAMHGNVEMTKILLEHNSDLSLSNGEFTAQQFAELLDSSNVIRAALEEIDDKDQQQAFLDWIHHTAPGRKACAELLRKSAHK